MYILQPAWPAQQVSFIVSVLANLCACYPPRFQLLCTSMSNSEYCQRVLSRGVVKGWCQVVLSSGIVKGWCQVVSSSIGVLSVGVSSWFYMWQLYTHSCFVLWLKSLSAHSNENEVPCNCSVSVTCLTNTRSVDSTCRYDWAQMLRHLELQICPDHIILG